MTLKKPKVKAQKNKKQKKEITEMIDLVEGVEVETGEVMIDIEEMAEKLTDTGEGVRVERTGEGETRGRKKTTKKERGHTHHHHRAQRVQSIVTSQVTQKEGLHKIILKVSHKLKISEIKYLNN